MQRCVQFAEGEYYHVLNRGVEGRDIFLDRNDYQRFLEGLKEFNTSKKVTIREVRLNRGQTAGIPSGLSSVPKVKILCFCLLPNHFHLLLKQTIENGVSEFMKKLGTGYACYFNTRYEHHGHLFQSAFKAVLVNKESQFLHLSRYIHLNALDLFQPEWREGKVENWEEARNFLENYPWSSYPIFIGKQKSDFCQPELLGEIFKNPQDYEKFIQEWAEHDLIESPELRLE